MNSPPPRSSWRDQATCRGVSWDVFLDNSKGLLRSDWREAHSYCSACPVAFECLVDAVATKDLYSFRGGLAPTERLPLVAPDYTPAPGTDPERTQHLRRRLLNRIRGGSVPMAGRICSGCGEKFNAASGVQRLCICCTQ